MSDATTNRTIQTRYWLGDVVYLRVNGEQIPGMVTRLTMTVSGSVTYGVTWRGGSETWHFDAELTTEYVPDFGTYAPSAEKSQ